MYGLPQIRLFGAGGKSSAGSTALHVHDHQRYLQHEGQPHCFGLQRDAGTAACRDAERTTITRTDGRADRCDLIFRLEGDHAEILVSAELVQDVARRCDRIAAVEEVELRFLRASDQTQCSTLVTGDAAVRALRHRRGLHLEACGEGLAGLAVVVTRDQRFHVGFQNIGLRAELSLQETFRERILAAVHPIDETEHEHVLATVLLLHAEGGALQRVTCQLGHIHAVQLELRQRSIRQGIHIFRLARKAQVLLVEAVGVGDDGATLFQLPEVGFQCGGVHYHQHIGLIAGRKDLHTAEVKLVAAHTGQRALRRTDLRREIREGAYVVAEQRVGIGELAAGQLDAVAAVTRKEDHHVLAGLYQLGFLDGRDHLGGRRKVTDRDSLLHCM